MTTSFNIKRVLFISAILMISLICGCASAAKKQSGTLENTIICKDPRRSMCTMEYRPVCGHFKDGTVKTFSNPCTACSNENVVQFTHGPCSE